MKLSGASGSCTSLVDGLIKTAVTNPRNDWMRGMRQADDVLDRADEPAIGAHIMTPRRAYTHHGIYVGEGRVVQYPGLSRGLRRGPVEEVSLCEFAQGREIWMRLAETSHFSPADVVRRARLRLGENRYHPLTNNCEHFCEWCVRGEARSHQVDELAAHYPRVWQRLLKLLDRTPLLRRRSVSINSKKVVPAMTEPAQTKSRLRFKHTAAPWIGR